MSRKLGIVTTILTIVLFWLYWQKSHVSTSIQTNQPNISAPISDAINTPIKDEVSNWVPPAITYSNYQSEYGTLPQSLEGTRVPFHLGVNEQGELIVNQNLRRLFDYFFTTVGEEPIETILARIEELLLKNLPTNAQHRALEILNQYFELKNAEIELARQLDLEYTASGQKPDLTELRRLQRDLRGSTLDPEVYAAFYGIDDKREDYTLEKLAIRKDTSLTDEERQAALEAIEEYLPPADRKHLQAERKAQNLYKEVQDARDSGATEAEIFQLREQVYGAEVAQRYAEADSKKALWDARIADYRAQRAEILNTDGLTEDDKNNEIDQLRQQHFEGNERKRIPVIDRMLDSNQ